ncbi:hypothetical protein D0863_13644 [Hortaea werneckii]|uniref:Uncharacterized protein n=2 Tax=Hortaea werneckii TaxID=91943 RepID=A0A3M7CQJ7_HORWE|nr:hypothetical protein D0863_13644 [Hortaea werneckii]
MDEKRAEMSENERTPLLQRVPVEDRDRVRYPHTTVRRFCTIALTAVPLLTLAIIFFCLAISGQSDLFGDPDYNAGSLSGSVDVGLLPHEAWPSSDGIKYDKLKQILQSTPDASKAREWSKYYTSGMHLTGKNLSQAEWTRDRWQEWGVESNIVSYDVYLNYPLDHRLALLENGEVSFEATLEEEILAEDPTTGLKESVPVFHGYSASGDVTAPYVYCNYGTYQDYEDLLQANVSLKGKIALVKYGGIFRALKIKRASELGMVGAILYSDPGDDGEMTEENGYKPYPEGPARNPSSVQRGSVEYLSIAPGDPTTLGYPSLPGAPRESVEGRVPDIPSLPVSYAEALPLLKALNGHGPNASDFGSSWQGGGLGYKGVNYNIGPTPDSVAVNVMNKQNYTITPLWNVIGVINGSIPDEVVVVGNHRDAWIAGGAGDPNSGSASMNEVIRAFGKALSEGWKPLRTIVFASWDGEEYSLLGSTEWVEEYLPWLSEATVAYINVDVGSVGPIFSAAAAPVLNQALYDVTKEVQSPNQTVKGQSVRDLWDGRISTMGSGSDFTAFQDFAGISCINVGFEGGDKDAVYHYHSNYDSFHWMDTYGDPGFEYHIAIAQVIALLTAKLVEEPIISFSAADYAVGLKSYLKSVEDMAEESKISEKLKKNLFKSLRASISTLAKVAQTFDSKAAELSLLLGSQSQLDTTSTTTSESSALLAQLYADVRATNTKYKLLDRQFLYAPGLDSRSWFKHVVFAPGLWTGYSGATFPGIVEALEFGNETALERWVDIVEQRVDGAIGLLEN